MSVCTAQRGPFLPIQHGPAKPFDLELLLGGATHDGSMSHSSEWKDFVPLKHVAINHPWLARHSSSALMHFDNGPNGINAISTADHEVYGNPTDPLLFRLGAGTISDTGIVKLLCQRYIAVKGDKFSIGMVRNTSRHSQVALLADVVQIALTQEAHNEDMAIREGWCSRACKVFNDHFILTGPASNPAGLQPFLTLSQSLRVLIAGGDARHDHLLFRSNGDGSSIFYKKAMLWSAAGIDISNPRWAKSGGLSPRDAVKEAAQDSAYLLIDRATYLTAKDAGLIPTMRVFVEGGEELLNPCSALLNTKAGSEASRAAAEFAQWLCGEEAQELVRHYGKTWSYAKPLFTIATTDEFDRDQRLAGKL